MIGMDLRVEICGAAGRKPAFAALLFLSDR